MTWHSFNTCLNINGWPLVMSLSTTQKHCQPLKKQVMLSPQRYVKEAQRHSKSEMQLEEQLKGCVTLTSLLNLSEPSFFSSMKKEIRKSVYRL